MPIYQYRCPDCNMPYEYFSDIQNGAFEPPTCYLCGILTRRIWTAPGIILKGNGWASKS